MMLNQSSAVSHSSVAKISTPWVETLGKEEADSVQKPASKIDSSRSNRPNTKSDISQHLLLVIAQV